MLEYNEETAAEHELFVLREFDREDVRAQYQDSQAPHFAMVKEAIKQSNYEYSAFRQSVRAGLLALETAIKEQGSVASSLYGSDYYRDAFKPVAKELMSYRIDDLFDLDVTHYIYDDKALYNLLKKVLAEIERPARFGFSPFKEPLANLDAALASVHRGQLSQFFQPEINEKLRLMRELNGAHELLSEQLARCGRIEQTCVRIEEDCAKGVEEVLQEMGKLQETVIDLEVDNIRLKEKVEKLQEANAAKEEKNRDLLQAMADLKMLVEANNQLMTGLSGSSSHDDELLKKNAELERRAKFLTSLLEVDLAEGDTISEQDLKQLFNVYKTKVKPSPVGRKAASLSGQILTVSKIEPESSSDSASRRLAVPYNSPNSSPTKMGSPASSGEFGLFGAKAKRQLFADSSYGIASDPGSYSPKKGSQISAH